MSGITFSCHNLLTVVFDDLNDLFYLRLRNEIKDWLAEHSFKYELRTSPIGSKYLAEIFFQSIEEAMIFKLAWL